MAFGTPVTNEFRIGAAEIRLGPMTSANKLKATDSMGLLQSANVTNAQESVDLEGGLPKTLIDSVVTRNTVTVSANAHEFSRRNIRTFLNMGTESVAPTQYAGTIDAAYTAGVTSTEVIQTTILLADVSVGDLVVVYPAGEPEKVSVVRVASVAARTNPNQTMAAITIDGTKTPILFNLPQGSVIYRANQLPFGGSNATQYFSMDVLSLNHTTGRPMVLKFWKVAVSGSVDFAFNSDNFAVVPVTFKVLQPAASEYGAGKPLAHLADIIPSHPFGMYLAG